jgi:ubiquitin carboxyl-terminal hydrolase 1
MKRETIAVDKEALRDLGLGGISRPIGSSRLKDIGKTVFDGLTANRRSCVVCGYTEAVMHFAFDNLQLAVPRAVRFFFYFCTSRLTVSQAVCDLRECLYEYTRLEKLTDCICRKCSLLATHQKLRQEAERLTALTVVDPNASSSKKKRARDARKLEAKVKVALEEGRLEDDIPGIKMEKVYSQESTKQAMIARVGLDSIFPNIC